PTYLPASSITARAYIQSQCSGLEQSFDKLTNSQGKLTICEWVSLVRPRFDPPFRPAPMSCRGRNAGSFGRMIRRSLCQRAREDGGRQRNRSADYHFQVRQSDHRLDLRAGYDSNRYLRDLRWGEPLGFGYPPCGYGGHVAAHYRNGCMGYLYPTGQPHGQTGWRRGAGEVAVALAGIAL